MMASVKSRSSTLSFSGRNGRSLKLSGIHAPTQSFNSGGCSGLSRKSPVLTYEPPATMWYDSSIVKVSSRVPHAERRIARPMIVISRSQPPATRFHDARVGFIGVARGDGMAGIIAAGHQLDLAGKM